MLRACQRARQLSKLLAAQQRTKLPALLIECGQPNLPAPCAALQGAGQLWRGFAKQPPYSETPVDHEHVNISNEIDKEIMRAHDLGTSKAMFEVIEHHGEDFNQVNVCTCFKHLSDLAQDEPSHREEIIKDEKFELLLDMVVMGRRKYDVTQLAGVVEALGKLHYDNDVIFDRLSQHLMDKLPKASAQDLAQLGTALARVDHSPSVVLFEAIQRKAGEVKADFQGSQKKDLKAAFEKFGYNDLAAKL